MLIIFVFPGGCYVVKGTARLWDDVLGRTMAHIRVYAFWENMDVRWEIYL
jgi:hypothetical protein